MTDEVVHTDAPGKPAAEAKPKAKEPAAAAPTLEEALAEVPEAPRSEPPRPAPTPRYEAPRSHEDAIAERVATRMEERRKAEETATRDIADAVRIVKGDLRVRDGFVETYLHGLAAQNTRFLTAFRQRADKPDAWRRVLEAARGQFAEHYQIDSDATVDRAAIREAARSAATKPPPRAPLDARLIARMTDQEFASFKKTGQVPDRLKGGQQAR
jgi:hypothetical protein